MESSMRDENSLCRICLKLDVTMNIFGQACREKQIAMKLNTCFSLKISETDNKQTHNICLPCFFTLEAANDLRLKAQRSDQILSYLFQLNDYKLPVAALSTAVLSEQKKLNIQCSTNTSELNVEPVFNCEVPQKRAVSVKKENESLQLTIQQFNENGENLKPAKHKLYKQTIQKMKPTNRLGDLESHEHFNNKIIANSNPPVQTPCFTTPQGPVLTHSPSVRNALQRKRPREQSVGSINPDANGELLAASSVPSTPKYQNRVHLTPKRNLFSQIPQTPIAVKEAPKSKASHKQSNELLPDNENVSTKTYQTFGTNLRSPLSEKVITTVNCPAINMQTPKTKQPEKKLIRKDLRTPANAKSTKINLAEKKEGRDSSVQKNLENVSAGLATKNIDEFPKEIMGNLNTTGMRGAVDRCINENRAEIRTKTPSKLRRAKELEKRTKDHEERMKRLDKEHGLATKDAGNVFEFTVSPAEETIPRFTRTRTVKRPTIVESSETCFEIQPAKSSEVSLQLPNKKFQQDKRASGTDHNKSTTILEELNSSLGTLASQQSEEQTTTVKSITKLLPDDVRESWKKTAGTWESQNISNESEDTFNDDDLEACMATGDIFGASIARKMTNANIKNYKMNLSSEEKTHNVKKTGTNQGKKLLPSPLSTPSSNGDPPKSSISSLNFSSGDESLKIGDVKSALIEKNSMPVPKTPGKNIDAMKDTTKLPLKSLNTQSKSSGIEQVFSSDSGQSDSSEYHLTPIFMRSGKK